MKTVIIIVAVLFLLLTCRVHSARILGIFPMHTRSHYNLGSSLMRALAEDGHDVTVISSFGEKEPPKGTKYRDIILEKMSEEIQKRRNDSQTNVSMFELGDRSPFLSIPFAAYIMSQVSEWTLSAKNVQALINSNEKFDVVIIEQFFTEGIKPLAVHFNAIQIVFSSVGANYWISPLVANPYPLAYVPDTFLSYSSHMTFCERLTNTLIYLLNAATHHLYLYPKQKAISQKYIPNAADVYDVIYNASLVLLNTHPSLNQPIPHVPNMVEIGGFHVKPPKKLPQDLQDFLDNAKDGVIYFSMGSNLRGADLPAAKRDAILKVFSKLKQKVLWKWEEDVLPGQPKNVKLGKWFPQQDILAHPNIRFFITHGGLLSTTETIYSGVPILAIPVLGDQKLNAQTAVNGGFGLTLPYKELCEEKLSSKVEELLNNPKYSINAKAKSKVFHDRQVKPIDTALYWVNYVIRHNGAPHLRVAGIDLPWYKYHLVDVIAFMGFVSFLSVFITCFILRKMCKKFCLKKKDNKLKKH